MDYVESQVYQIEILILISTNYNYTILKFI